ncbi:SrpA-related protein [hydrothermal vent metagenome]|uniref:SrpA-related protein n=1 Tax=hydrothermal vent metagenome TaxID=652676 RepID=A0A3B0T7Q2_9ZZZZ
MFQVPSSVPAQGIKLPGPPTVVDRPDNTSSQVGGSSEQRPAARPSFGPATRVEVSAVARPATSQSSPRAPETRSEDPEALSEDQKRQIQKLRQRDAEVRAHEHAHSAAGGGLAGAASYEFTTGPDGKRYAAGGEVQIDVSPVRDNPAATIAKMDIVIRAALAPAQPSAQDQAVARAAAQARSEAQNELQRQKKAENSGGENAETTRSVTASERLAAIRAYIEQTDIVKDFAASIFNAGAPAA